MQETCAVWVTLGLLLNPLPPLLFPQSMVLVNGFGVLISLYSIYFYHKFSQGAGRVLNTVIPAGINYLYPKPFIPPFKIKAERSILIGAALVAVALLFARFTPKRNVLTPLGLLCCAFSIIMFGSPLVSVVSELVRLNLKIVRLNT